ncbi:MAG: hypothetical protein IIZ45_06080, partial [Firmicutes bacterium]|nr:hypothetical protein [Bacillota bacterium]
AKLNVQTPLRAFEAGFCQMNRFLRSAAIADPRRARQDKMRDFAKAAKRRQDHKRKNMNQSRIY